VHEDERKESRTSPHTEPVSDNALRGHQVPHMEQRPVTEAGRCPGPLYFCLHLAETPNAAQVATG
jgi:hypothetical protein